MVHLSFFCTVHSKTFLVVHSNTLLVVHSNTLLVVHSNTFLVVHRNTLLVVNSNTLPSLFTSSSLRKSGKLCKGRLVKQRIKVLDHTLVYGDNRTVCIYIHTIYRYTTCKSYSLYSQSTFRGTYSLQSTVIRRDSFSFIQE